MSLDINNPAHLDALRWACESRMGRAPGPCEAHGGLVECMRMVSRITQPQRAASLVRDLLARAGVDVGGYQHGNVLTEWQVYDNCGDRIHVHGHLQPRAPDVFRVLWPKHWMGLILALLDLAPGDSEGATRVLREVGR